MSRELALARRGGVKGPPGGGLGKGLWGGRGLVHLRNLGVGSVAWNKTQEVEAKEGRPGDPH